MGCALGLGHWSPPTEASIPWDFPSSYDSVMRDLVVLFIHFLATLARLLGPGRVKVCSTPLSSARSHPAVEEYSRESGSPILLSTLRLVPWVW